MRLSEVFDELEEEDLGEAKMVWARSGKRLVRKYRCTSGRRKGRIVSSPTKCNAPVNIKTRQRFKQARLAKGARMARKRKRTLRTSPLSKRLQRLNR